MVFTEFLNQIVVIFFSQLTQLWLSFVQEFLGLDFSAFVAG